MWDYGTGNCESVTVSTHWRALRACEVLHLVAERDVAIGDGKGGPPVQTNTRRTRRRLCWNGVYVEQLTLRIGL